METVVLGPKLLQLAEAGAVEIAAAVVYLIFGLWIALVVLFGPSIIGWRLAKSRLIRFLIPALSFGGFVLVPLVSIAGSEELTALVLFIALLLLLSSWVLALRTRAGLWKKVGRDAVSVLIVAVFARTFLFQPFNIPDGGNLPTLVVGDYFLVSKFPYGYSNFSFPFSPVFLSGRLFPSQPRHGDLVVFRNPRSDFSDRIGRIVGLSGDRVQLVDGIVNINGVPAKHEHISRYEVTSDDGVVHLYNQYTETLPNGISYKVLGSYLNNTPVYTVPSGHYFIMGDNRGNSGDSRSANIGYVPYENLIGRAAVIWLSIRDGEHAWEIWRWPWSVRWNRLFAIVR